MSTGQTTYRLVKAVFERLIDPLRADESITHFTLSIPDAQTTTVDSVQGWQKRPPAILRCANCQTQIIQHRATSKIDCPYCYKTYSDDEFGDLALLDLICPRCETSMDHGKRHPQVFDIPEWATCHSCQYHWDLSHWY